MNILLVEPNVSVGLVIKKYLEQHIEECFVNVTRSSQEAIHMADKTTPDLVILELALTMHNGFAFLYEFRSYPDWEKVPVIIHSHLAKEEASMSKSWDALGAQAYLYKPNTTLKALLESVKDTLAP